MSAYNLYSTEKANEALTAIGGTGMGQQEIDLLKQIFVASSVSSGSSFDPTNPGPIGGTTPASGTFTRLIANSGTLTASAPHEFRQTWNNAGTTFQGLDIVITDTASAAASTPFRILGGAAGTTELLVVGKTGDITNNGTAFGSFTIQTKAGSNRNIQLIADGAGSVILSGTSVQSFNAFRQRGTAGFGTARNSKFRFATTDNDDDGSDGALVVSGSGTPEGAKTAPPGSIYLNQAGGSGTSLYYKATGTGNTGWSAVA